MRVFLVSAGFIVATSVLIAVQWLLLKLRLPGWGFLAVGYYRLICALLGIRVHVVGKPLSGKPLLMIGNHVSWADILVIGSILPVAFVSKLEIAEWPLVGAAAKLQRTVFVDRSRRHQTGDAITDIVDRLTKRIPVVLFAEGTSNDGNRVLPFRSSLVGAVQGAAGKDIGDPVLIQPFAICYTRSQGLPLGRQHRTLVAWYGDLDFTPHLKTFIRRAAVDVTVAFGEPIGFGADRKAVTRAVESQVRRMATATLRGRKPATEPASA